MRISLYYIVIPTLSSKPLLYAMNCLSLSFLFFVFSVSSFRLQGHEVRHTKLSQADRANLPPRGWNSYDSFGWSISEVEFLENAAIISRRLSPHGYEYVVVDYLWYRKKVSGAYPDSLGFDVIDEWGRMVPDPGRWPSSRTGNGFTDVAKKVHGMGLKFGIHVMRGLSRQAYDANTLILDITTGRAYEESGRKWRAKDIGIKERSCAWMQHGFMSVNTKLGAGRAFLRSLYQQYAEWGVDLVKHDCVFGDDLDIDEIAFVSEVLQKLDRPIIYSLSPGTSVTPTMAKDVSGLVNMYRITGDDWDTWGDVAAHFDVTRDFSAANMTGAKSLLGKSWPDLDMLPMGWLTDPGSNEGPHRTSKLSLDEQRTQMTLWAMAKSPLMFGGDVRKLDEPTFALITNPTILEIDYFSSDNKEFSYVLERKVSISQARRKSRRHLKKIGTSLAPVLGVTSCKDPTTNSWFIEALGENLDQICWKGHLGNQKSFCLYKRKNLLVSDEHIIYQQRNHHLYANEKMNSCLDSSSRRKQTSKETKDGSFSFCQWDAHQMWELNSDGALVSNYSGLCARVDSVESKAEAPVGVRSWIATGRKGEIYLALFNLNSAKTVISAKLSDMAKALPGKNLNGASCIGREVWTKENLGVIKDSVSMAVETHGCALLILNCS